jgi:hypothetical protein
LHEKLTETNFFMWFSTFPVLYIFPFSVSNLRQYDFALILVCESPYVTIDWWVKYFSYTVMPLQIVLASTVITDHCNCSGTCMR